MTRTGHAFFTEGGGSFTDGGPVKMLGITTSGEEPSTPHQIVEQARGSLSGFQEISANILVRILT